MGRKRKSPQSAKELLERYAAGERDFAGADLQEAELREADLSGAILEGANLHGADLHRAVMCRADLRCAAFGYANLTGAHLAFAVLERADLERANLGGVDMYCTNLREAYLSGATLINARLRNTDLRDADLRGADLRWANLMGTNLQGARLHAARLDGARLESAVLLHLNLAPFCDADPPVEHYGPSTVDYESISLSIGAPKLKSFLVRTGMPEVFVEYMIDCARSLDPVGVFKLLHSTFISYGSPDEAFVRKLYEALHQNGVTTFFFPEHAVPGKKIGRTMRQGVNDFDRILLVCSKDSLDRKGVLAEIEHSLSREDREGGAELVIPVVLDDYLFSGWKPTNRDVLLTLKERVAADFRGWDRDPTKFDAGLRRLIGALKK